MAEVGHFSICLAWLISLIGLAAGAAGGVMRNSAWTETSRRALLLSFFFTLLSTIALGAAFVTDYYELHYVWSHSNHAMHPLYKVAAIWGGMDGSMLLWCMFLTLNAALFAYQSHRKKYDPTAQPWAFVWLHSASLFFISVVVFLTNPFRYINSPLVPHDGNGLNPLLQNPYMAIHPPLLYIGFTFFAVPVGLCIGSLVSGSLSNEWVQRTRTWSLVAWLFLTAGIVLGGYWAYLELGWGGFWAWDPVENASFMPWLIATAYLHSSIVQQRRNMLRVWNVWLIVLTYALTVFGTFLTRSGIVQSVHAFASTDVGWVFLVYLALILVTATALTVWRLPLLRGGDALESLFSREAVMLVNNLLFLSIAFAVLWGVMFPVLSEAVTGTKSTVSAPFFNQVTVPFFLVMLLLMGVGPLIAWRRGRRAQLVRAVAAPGLIALLVGAAVLWGGVRDFYATLAYVLCAFVISAVGLEFHRGRAVQKSTTTLLRRHRVRYAGLIVHVGVAVAAIGITASMVHKVEREFTVTPGNPYAVENFTFTVARIGEEARANHHAMYATVVVHRQDGAPVVALRPELRTYHKNQEVTSEVALRMGLREDIYVVLAGYDLRTETVSLKVYINPLQIWLWIGTLIMIGGTLLGLLPARRQQPEG